MAGRKGPGHAQDKLQAAGLGVQPPALLGRADPCGELRKMRLDCLSLSELPLVLPEIKDFEPTGDGESPLARHTEWVNTTLPVLRRPAKRETDTMPQWAGSSWYFLRYMDPHNNDALASREALEYLEPCGLVQRRRLEHHAASAVAAGSGTSSCTTSAWFAHQGAVPAHQPRHDPCRRKRREDVQEPRQMVNPDDIVRDYGADNHAPV